MCGISGLFGPDGDDARIAHSMASLLEHRGPDGTRSWSTPCRHGGIGFGHTRLSIVDIIGSDQPLSSDNGCVLIVNGEIYNHKEIRATSRHYPWRTKGDGEAILAAYASRGDSADWLNSIDGIWGFALWDPNIERLILSRDPLGVKPLVRTLTQEGTLLFASETKALRAHPQHTPALDEEALVARLAFEYPLDDTTLLKDVHQVRPGTVEVWMLNENGAQLQSVTSYSQDVVAPSKHWDITKAPALLESLTSSLADRLMSDVPLGIVLSGGLDSAMVAALAHEAAERTGYPVPACWTVAESEDNPDWMAAVEVCEALDLEHHQHILAEDAFSSALPDLAWFGEDLDFTVLFFQPLFKHMSEAVTVGLCGQGSDELHAGYSRYQNLSNHRNIIRTRLENSQHPFANKLLNTTIEQPGWTGASHHPDVVFADLTHTLQYELDHGQLTNFQLRLVDRHSMAHGLEVRVPFLGSAHRNAARKLPLDWRLSAFREKIALRAAADQTSLPKSIVNRPKLPAGRATSPTMIDNLLTELDGHARQYANDIPSMSKMFDNQPEISLGLRLFRSMHITDGGLGRHGKNLMTLLEDVD
jgi:asparagine synthase (glutamine-hydrolysing)